ncbi:unnamed protein product, partial [Brachionus calyciflorus]
MFLIYISASIYSTGDSEEFNSGNYIRNLNLTVTASDIYTSKTINVEISVQNPITEFIIQTNPTNLLIINYQNQSPKSIGFSIFLDSNVTEPFYLVDYGDGSLINFAEKIFNFSANFTYAYLTSGYYKVNITVFNKVSSISKYLIVRLVEDFVDFECFPTWRLFPFDFADDFNLTKIGNAYLAKKEYDIRIKCYWLNKDSPIENYTLQYGSYFYVSEKWDQSNIVKTDEYAELIITLSSDILKNENVNEIFIAVSNELFQKVYKAIITPVSSIKDIIPITDLSVSKRGDIRNFNYTFDSLGEPSCALVVEDSNNFNNLLFTIGTNEETCTSYYPYIPFKEKYQTQNKTLSFSAQMTRIGLINYEIYFKNEYSTLTVITSVTASTEDCNRPRVDIENRSSLFYQPRIIQRSKRFSIIGITKVNCKKSFKNLRKWSLFSIRESNGRIIREISITSNPTSSFTELVIPSNSLSYGLYKFVYKVQMFDTNSDLAAFQIDVDHYVKIVPSGIVVQLFPGGMTNIRRGLDQNIILDPTIYSYDLDSYFSVKNLKFKFYCSIIEDGIIIKSPLISLNKFIDLESIKFNYTRNFSSISCFDSLDSYFFRNNGNLLNITAR